MIKIKIKPIIKENEFGKLQAFIPYLPPGVMGRYSSADIPEGAEVIFNGLDNPHPFLSMEECQLLLEKQTEELKLEKKDEE